MHLRQAVFEIYLTPLRQLQASPYLLLIHHRSHPSQADRRAVPDMAQNARQTAAPPAPPPRLLTPALPGSQHDVLSEAVNFAVERLRRMNSGHNFPDYPDMRTNARTYILTMHSALERGDQEQFTRWLRAYGWATEYRDEQGRRVEPHAFTEAVYEAIERVRYYNSGCDYPRRPEVVGWSRGFVLSFMADLQESERAMYWRWLRAWGWWEEGDEGDWRVES